MMQASPQAWRSPKLAALMAHLAAIARADINPADIERCAERLHVEAMMLSAGLHRRAYELKSTQPIVSPGKTAALARLKRAASSGSLKRWSAAWAGVDSETTCLVIKHMGPAWARRRDWRLDACIGVVTDNFSRIAPRPEIALVGICDALAELAATPAAERRKRVADPQTADFISSARDVYLAVTGKSPTPTWDSHIGKYVGGFIELMRKIDAIYETRLAASSAPSRLKKRK